MEPKNILVHFLFIICLYLLVCVSAGCHGTQGTDPCDPMARETTQNETKTITRYYRARAPRYSGTAGGNTGALALLTTLADCLFSPIHFSGHQCCMGANVTGEGGDTVLRCLSTPCTMQHASPAVQTTQLEMYWSPKS